MSLRTLGFISPPREPYGFVLFPGRFGERWGDIPDEKHIFIHFSDFELVLDIVRGVYPLRDPETDEIQEGFDICGMNPIHNAAWQGILEEMRNMKPGSELEAVCIADLIDWIEANLAWADEIMVEGTL